MPMKSMNCWTVLKNLMIMLTMMKSWPLGLRLHPGNPDLQIRQCKSYVYNEDYDSALALIESIAETDNQDLDMLRLECYVMQDSYDKVIGHVENSSPTNASI